MRRVLSLKRKKNSKPAQTELSKRIENGKPIAGMIGYVGLPIVSRGHNEDDIDNQVFVKVKAKRIKTEGCGMTIEVSVLSGVGILEITPCAWLDTPKDIEARREYKDRLNKAVEDLEMLNKPIIMSDRRAELISYAKERMNGSFKKFLDHAKEVCSRGSTKTITIENASSSDVSSLAKDAVMIVHNLSKDDVDVDSRITRH